MQETYSISTSTLPTLDRVAGNRNIPSDFLVEVSINRLRPIFGTRLEKHK